MAGVQWAFGGQLVGLWWPKGGGGGGHVIIAT